jgi:hypothetical protein
MATAEQHLGGDDIADVDVVGARVGLAIVCGMGLVLGTATCLGLWYCYPPAHGVQWPMPTIAVGSAIVLIAGYVTLRRRIGPTVADWFVLGYVVAMVGMAAIIFADDVVQFVRGQLEILDV